MKILAIESSCDETATAILNIDENKIDIVSNVVSSSMGIQKQYGGVVPEVAARVHGDIIHQVIQEALQGNTAEDGSDIDLIAVTRGPGLKTSLLVGINAAETLGALWSTPVIGVNHLEGHILSPLLEHKDYPLGQEAFPIIVLTTSGGHTQIVLMTALGEYEIIGTTIDDAAGEAFDKVAKMLGLGYPGGPVIDKLAKKGNPEAFDFPRPILHSKDYRFSFSGLKTAVKYAIRDLNVEKLSDQQTADVAASFQKAVVDVLVIKTLRAVEEYSAQTVFLAGGVGANTELRETLQNIVKENFNGVNCVLIDRRYSGDNAAMIALAGYFQYLRENKNPLSIEVDPKLGVT